MAVINFIFAKLGLYEKLTQGIDLFNPPILFLKGIFLLLFTCKYDLFAVKNIAIGVKNAVNIKESARG